MSTSLTSSPSIPVAVATDGDNEPAGTGLLPNTSPPNVAPPTNTIPQRPVSTNPAFRNWNRGWIVRVAFLQVFHVGPSMGNIDRGQWEWFHAAHKDIASPLFNFEIVESVSISHNTHILGRCQRPAFREGEPRTQLQERIRAIEQAGFAHLQPGLGDQFQFVLGEPSKTQWLTWMKSPLGVALSSDELRLLGRLIFGEEYAG